MSEIKGKYFPVGHGLTYGFKVGEYHILFDIAKPKKIDIILKDLETFFGNKHINVLTLSHFHYDHIAGIEKLLDNGFQFDKLNIPYVLQEQMIIVNFYYISTIVKTTIRILNQSSNGDDNGVVFEILDKYKKFDITNDLFFEKDLENVFLEKNKKIEIVKISENYNTIDFNEAKVESIGEWFFHYFNSVCYSNSKILNFYSELRKIGIPYPSDLNSQLKNKYGEVERIYKEIFKDLNLTSIFLVHGPIDPRVISETIVDGSEFSKKNVTKRISEKKSCSLISGDMYLGNKDNQNKLINYVDKIKYALIPHHSSLVSWSSFISDKNNDVLWIVTIAKVGARPYGRVVKDIYMNNQEIYICDGKEFFEYEFILE